MKQDTIFKYINDKIADNYASYKITSDKENDLIVKSSQPINQQNQILAQINIFNIVAKERLRMASIGLISSDQALADIKRAYQLLIKK